MEIKLTTDWIFLHNSEVHCNEDAECYITLYEEFDYYLAELALLEMNINYFFEEVYADTDLDFKNPFYRYLFIDIEEIRDSAPLLYSEFLKSIHEEGKRQEETEHKKEIILKYLEIPRSLIQIHSHFEEEYFKNEKQNGSGYLIIHTEYFVKYLIEEGLIKLENEKYSLV